MFLSMLLDSDKTYDPEEQRKKGSEANRESRKQLGHWVKNNIAIIAKYTFTMDLLEVLFF